MAGEGKAKRPDFNPRSREGSDLVVDPNIVTATKFQSTLPRGERRSYKLRNTRSICNFNPRSREGSDYTSVGKCDGIADFNPRSREGSDITSTTKCRSRCYFNPRSREGSDTGRNW